jgi:hypothetical protein
MVVAAFFGIAKSREDRNAHELMNEMGGILFSHKKKQYWHMPQQG